METDVWLKSNPADIVEMEHVGSRLTVCEILREIYKMTEDPEIQMKCRVATSIAKSMAARITKYEGRNWGKRQYPYNPRVVKGRIEG